MTDRSVPEEATEIASLREEVVKLRKINAALMDRVERSTDMQGSAFSMFEKAISLEQLVRERTQALEDAMARLAAVNVRMAEAHSEADAARLRLRDAIESINEGFALFDADDRLILCNEAYISLWPEVAGLVADRPTFREIANLIAARHPPIGALVAPDRWVSDRLARHSVATGGHVQALADGRWIQINELRTSEGGIVGIYTDITEVKAQDARQRALELAERNLALQAIIDNLVEGVCMFDRDHVLTAWNEALQRMLDVGGKDTAAIVTHADLVARCRDSLGMTRTEALAWREDQDGRVHNSLCVTGSRTWEVRTTAMATGGMVIGFVDVTDAIKARQMLQDTADTLERRVAERTSELLDVNRRLETEIAERRSIEAQLLDAKTAAEKANLSKTSFIAAASHDLLQPLNAARLFVAALAERRLALPTRALVNQTSTALDSVEDLLEALLEISRLDAGAITPELADFNLGWLLDTMRTEFAPVARSAGLDFTITAQPLWVHSDVRLLRRILQNLVSNAIRYTQEGAVSVESIILPSGAVKISVRDTGPGIPVEQQEIIFEEFRRLDTSRRMPGKGLGLAIVKRATDMLNHPLELKSGPGKGACFSVTVPAGEPQTQNEADKAGPSRERSVRGRRILVIDNEAQIQAGMETLLAGWGCEVATANNCTAAIAGAETGLYPDVVIADFHLDDGLTGDQAIRNIRDHLGWQIPAIIISADRTDELKARLKNQGLPLLSKPVKPAQLRALLHTLLP